jgi:hypothetical protein
VRCIAFNNSRTFLMIPKTFVMVEYTHANFDL